MIFQLPRQVVLSNAGDLLPGSKAYFYDANTSVPMTTYSDYGQTVPHTNPVIADGNGRFPIIYISDGVDYKVKITDADDVELYSNDNLGEGGWYPVTEDEENLGITVVEQRKDVGHANRYVVNSVPGTTDCSVGIQAAFDIAKDRGVVATFNPGERYLFNTNLTIEGGTIVDGNFATLEKNTDIVGITITGGASFNDIYDLTLKGVGVAAADGSAATGGHGVEITHTRCRFRNFIVQLHKGNGFEIDCSSTNMNRCEWGMGTRVMSTSNDGDGFNFTGTNDNASIWQGMYLHAAQNRGLGIRMANDFMGRQWQGYWYLEDNAQGGGYDVGGKIAANYIGKLRFCDLMIYAEENAIAFGTHTGSNNASVLTDSTQSWTVNSLIGAAVSNTTDGSSGTVTANTATTITATLSGGTDNDWDTSDAYTLTSKDIYFDTNTEGNKLFSMRLNKWEDKGTDNAIYRGGKNQTWEATHRLSYNRGINMSTSSDYMEHYYYGSSAAGEIGYMRYYGDGTFQLHMTKTSNSKTSLFQMQHPYHSLTTWNATGDLAYLVLRGSRGTEDTPLETDVGDKAGTLAAQAMNSSGAWKNIGAASFEVTNLGGGEPGGKFVVELMPHTASVLVTPFEVDLSTTAGDTRMLVWDVDNGTLERVTVGAADSGGAGYKVLRIPN